MIFETAEVIKSCIFSWIWGILNICCVELSQLFLFDLFIANSCMSVNFANKPDLQWGLNKFDYNCKQKVISNQAVFVKLCKKVVCVCVFRRHKMLQT